MRNTSALTLIAAGPLAVLGLVSCSSTQAESPQTTSPQASKQAVGLYRSTNLCIENASSVPVSVTFPFKDSQQGEGPIAKGSQLCAEGTTANEAWDVEANLDINGEKGEIGVYNKAIVKPEGQIFLDSAGGTGVKTFSVGDTIKLALPSGGPVLTLTRKSDDDWIQFKATVTDAK